MASEIAKRKEGERPSPGTIYPALKKLKEMDLIEDNKQGKTIIYILTPKRQDALKIAKRRFIKTFVGVFRLC